MNRLAHHQGIHKFFMALESVKTLWRTFFRFTTGVVNH
ncbi:hypothetical protein T260_01150 [Geobacillus thermopakistaniensis]|uniref:Uncharacterized protein n=1 Tax=Geobacillus thermopakistaniensis (strain MAS1) TaxID=1408282 RepID=A0A7U9JDY8_GEOTM|nr:hypothetical protein T260_01150 [Geobacillus sp. MAS1]